MADLQLAKSDGKMPRDRGQVLRDLVIFQIKMVLGSARDFALIPVSLGAALIDLFHKHDEKGYFFYKVLRWARHTEEMISLYSPVKDEAGEMELNPNHTVDAVVARIEDVVIREYQKGGTAASVKDAVERVVNQIRAKSRQLGAEARSVKTD